MNDCDHCRANLASIKAGSPLLCANSLWYPAGQIRFCRPQVMFLTEHIDILRDGEYPPNPAPNNYIDPDIHTQPHLNASWMTAAQLAAEIDARLQTVPGIQRALYFVEIQEERELSEYTIAVLNYISGWRRKTTPFRQWQYKKNGKKVTKCQLFVKKGA